MQSVIFKKRTDAGERLGESLSCLKRVIPTDRRPESLIIVGIPRGGVIVADVLASRFKVMLDIVVSRKIAAPDNPEFAIGAVMPDGSYFLNQDIINAIQVPKDYIQMQVSIQLKEINRRLISYRGSSDYDKEFDGKTVILVDDGIATGATILASAKWIKSKHRCKKLIITSPLAPIDTMNTLEHVADKVVVLYTPDPFVAIGRFYSEFEQVSDEQVEKIMKKYGYKVG